MAVSTSAAADQLTVDALGVVRQLCGSTRLRQRRFELVPISGPGAATVEPQGRAPGDSTTPAELAELISSIATVGVLQPVLIEELPDGHRRLVSGERRYRAVRWGRVHLPDNPHFAALPAVICPGPLTQGERRVWQLVENLARENLQPGELAAALLWERIAVLTQRLEATGLVIPAEVADLEDPVVHWQALDRQRRAAGHHRIGAPWDEVLARLGLQVRPDTARQLVRAFASLPADLSSEMDAHQVALATRLDFLRLDRGRRDAAAEIWDAVKQRGRPELLSGAVRHALDRCEVDADEAIAAADACRKAANEARGAALRVVRPDDVDDAHSVEPARGALVAGAVDALRALVAELRAGARPDRYTAGSLQLLAGEVLALLDSTP